jgi:hypothetical protein
MKTSAVTLCSVLLFAFAIGSADAAPAAAPSSDDRLNELDRRLDSSNKLIEQLSKRLHDLEARLAPPAATAQAPEQPAPAQDESAARLAAIEREVGEMAIAGATSSASSGLPVHGFADVGAGTRAAIDPDHKGFAVGSLDFYLTPELGERTRALFELNFEVDEDGELATDLERAQIGYQINNSATLWLGRFHTPYGYYNTAFHHGQQISTALRRPRFLQFEDAGGVMPAHTVGLWLTGTHRLGEARWTYDAFVGNAQQIEEGTLNPRQSGLTNAEFTVGGNLGYLAGGSLDGLKVGLSYYTSTVTDDALVQNRTRVNNYGLYATLDTDRWENLLEFYHFDNDDLSGTSGSHHSNAGFVQLAYRVERFAPYARYERATLAQTDPYFAAQLSGGSYYRSAIGVRFDLDLASALKLEFGRTVETDRAGDEFGDAMMQYAIRF